MNAMHGFLNFCTKFFRRNFFSSKFFSTKVNFRPKNRCRTDFPLEFGDFFAHFVDVGFVLGDFGLSFGDELVEVFIGSLRLPVEPRLPLQTAPNAVNFFAVAAAIAIRVHSVRQSKSDSKMG